MVNDNLELGPKPMRRREFGALETIMARCAGRFAVGDAISHADCFLVPQIRNALLAGIDLKSEFPNLSRVWTNAIAVPEVAEADFRASRLFGLNNPYRSSSWRYDPEEHRGWELGIEPDGWKGWGLYSSLENTGLTGWNDADPVVFLFL